MKSVNFKKWPASLTLASLLLVGATGCSSGSGAKEGAEVPPAPAQEDKTPITIQYWHAHADSQKEGLNYILEQFNKKYPWITIEPIYQGQYADLHKKLMAAVAAKSVPAVTNVEVASLPTFGDGGVFMDLGGYIKRDKLDVNDFSKGMFDAYAYKGKQYGLPLIVSTNVFIYNKKLFDELKVKPPQTWAEIEEFSKKVATRDSSGKPARYAFAVPGWDVWYAETWMRNGGGTPMTDDHKSGLLLPESLKYIKNFRQWMDKGYLWFGYGKGASDTMRQMFFDGKVGMVHHTSGQLRWYIDNAKFEVGASFPPGDKKHISQIGGAGIAIMDMASAKEKEAAWKFVQFITSAEHNIKWADGTGYLPTRKSAINGAEGQAYLAKYPQYKAIVDNFDNVVARPQYPPYPEAISNLLEAQGKIILENADIDQAFKTAAKAMDDVFRDYK